MLHVHLIRALILKGQLTLGRKWAQLHGSRRPNSYHDDDALHFWSVKPFDLSSSKRRRVSGTKRSRSDHTILRTEPRVRHDILLHSYRLYAPSCWCTTIATIKLYSESFRSRSVCRSRDDRSRTHARTRWSPDRSDRTHRTEPRRILRLRWERTPRSPTTPVRSAVELCTSTPTTKWAELESGEVQERQRCPGCSDLLFVCWWLKTREQENLFIININYILISLSLSFLFLPLFFLFLSLFYEELIL